MTKTPKSAALPPDVPPADVPSTAVPPTDAPTQPLRPARNAAARMQELMAGAPFPRPAPDTAAPPVPAVAVPTPSNEASIIPSNDAMIDGMNDASNEVSNDGSNEAMMETSSDALRDQLYAGVKANLAAALAAPPEHRGAATRLNVEMPEALHLRLKQYCVRTRTPIKALINALIAFYLDHSDEDAAP